MLGAILLSTVFLIASYLLGAFPFMLLLSKAKGHDLSGEPDYHIAMYRKVCRIAGLAGLIVDLLKGLITVVLANLLNLSPVLIVSAGVLVTLGQMWPVFQKFNGEKGNTTGGGAAIGFCLVFAAYWALYIALIVVVSGFLIRTVPRFFAPGQTFKEKLGFGGPPSNSLPLAMLIAFASLSTSSWLSGRPIEATIGFLIIFLAIVIRRLTAGVRKDINKKETGTCKILINRFLFDRSFY
jgi:glycerol-3-phosphate acyltransferase PlsY